MGRGFVFKLIRFYVRRGGFLIGERGVFFFSDFILGLVLLRVESDIEF